MKDLVLLSILNYYNVHLILNLIVNFCEVVYLKLILPKFDKKSVGSMGVRRVSDVWSLGVRWWFVVVSMGV